MSNQLKKTVSPYLLQHAENPVNWYPWCEEAFDKAKSEDKPIFLSIGYSTCHWCHVMAHESFESEKTAEILNQYFISIKVDREERPDIDSVYMSVCQAFTGSGGWPMSIFMTWDKKPFFAGTYFPQNSQYGMPGFSDLLKIIADQWSNYREKLLQSSEQIIEHLKNTKSNSNTNNENLLNQAIQIFSNSFDTVNGGFGSSPKFPTPHNLLILMLYAKQNQDLDALKMAEKTLLQMRKGGIFDHIGYGFSRYSTDKYFLVPHFEKMLYDNALLIVAYSAAYSLTNDEVYLDTAQKTASYIFREMTSDEGGFYSAQDADSEGVEGKFYTLSLKEIFDVLGEENGKQFAEAFDITEKGNFDGMNIPNMLKSDKLNANFNDERKKLYEYRKNRTKLHLDDKILLSWNSMMIAALSMLYRVSHNKKYLNAAINAEKFIEKNLCDGIKLYTSWRNGIHSDTAFLDDYAYYAAALIELYNSTLNSCYLKKAEQFCDEAIRLFYDNKHGGFYLIKSDNTELFMNPKEVYDGAIPSGNSIMAYNIVRLYHITENEKYLEFIKKQFEFLSSQASNYPAGYCMFLIAKILYENPPEHITIVLKKASDIEKVKINIPFLANIFVTKEYEKYPLLNDETTYYICKDHVCMPPTNILH